MAGLMDGLNKAVSKLQDIGEKAVDGAKDLIEKARPGMSQTLDKVADGAKDLVDKAREDWDNGVQLRLRFTHDSTMMPLLSYLGVNGMDARVEDPQEVENVWRNYNVPMAANVQLVFFRSKRNPDILFQFLLNGREATLPLPMAAPGSFYRWEDFKALVH